LDTSLFHSSGAQRALPSFPTRRSSDLRAAVVLCKPDLAQESGGPSCRVLVRDPHVALLSVIPVLYPEPSWTAGVHPTAVIGRGRSEEHTSELQSRGPLVCRPVLEKNRP